MRTVSIVLMHFLMLAAAACDNQQRAATASGSLVAVKAGVPLKADLPEKVAAVVRKQADELGTAAVIIRLNIDADLTLLTSGERAEAIRRVSDRVIARLSPYRVEIIHRYEIVPILAARADPAGLAAMTAIPEVKEVVLDRLEQPSLDRSTRRINAHLIWPTSIGSGRLVAILDTGTETNHSFVAPRVVKEACFRGDGKCPNWKVEQIGPGAAANIRAHGMHVAGIAAGENGLWRGVQLRGVAPGAGIIAINVFSQNGARVSDQVKALEYVAKLRESNVQVVAANLSLNGELSYPGACDYHEPERRIIIDRLLALGVATVISAGNKTLPNAVVTPACISNAVTVSSVTRQDGINTVNSRSSLTDFMAPGEAILSSLPHGVYGTQSGTSMAAPHVSGAIALLSATVPKATLPQILAALKSTGVPVHDQITGRTYRRINVAAALVHLQAQ